MSPEDEQLIEDAVAQVRAKLYAVVAAGGTIVDVKVSVRAIGAAPITLAILPPEEASDG